jgi:hypothetical protein
MSPKRRIAVAGDGVVGSRVIRALGDRADLSAKRVEELLPDLVPSDLVILATGGGHAPLAAQLAELGVSVVSVSDALDDISELLALDDAFRASESTLVVGAAMSPGLSGLLARYLADSLDSCDEIHVAFHATGGPQCARQHHRALAGHALGWRNGAWIQWPAGGGRELCWFPEPVGAKDCYRAELADPMLLQLSFPEVDRISARVSATRRDRLTARLPMLRPPHGEGGIGALRVEVRGVGVSGERLTLIAGVAEFVGAVAASVASACADAVVNGEAPVGVVTTSSPELDPRRLLDAVEHAGVRLQEFTGVPQVA